MDDLIARLEETQASSIQLNGAIFWLVDRKRAERAVWNAAPGLPRPLGDTMPEGLGKFAVDRAAPNYTGSIDAALTMLPADIWWLIGAGRARPDEPLYGVQLRKAGASLNDPPLAEAEHNANAAIPICIAILKALKALKARQSNPGRT